MRHLLYGLGFVGLAINPTAALILLAVVGTTDLVVERLANPNRTES